jgi:hypothetical protein
MHKRMYNPRIFWINYQCIVRSEARTYSDRGGAITEQTRSLPILLALPLATIVDPDFPRL